MGVIKNTKAGNRASLRFSAIDAGSVEFDDDKVGFFGAAPVAQQAHIANITTTATTGSLPTANSAVVIANTATPTVVELLEYCVELETKVEALLTALRNVGLLASS
jgi:hypothetical protein